jgi:hypothetical protein
MAKIALSQKLDEGWQRQFDDPITVDRRTLRTLREAADYIMKLPKAEQAKPHWQPAVRELKISADRNGIMMLAQIAMLQALQHGNPQPKPEQRKRAKKYRVVK